MSIAEVLTEVGPWTESLLRAIFFTLAATFTLDQLVKVAVMIRAGRGQVDMPWFPLGALGSVRLDDGVALMSTRRSLCLECGWHGSSGHRLRAPNPFDKGVSLYGCPGCRGVDLVEACDVDGCPGQSAIGTPTQEGYRWTCGDHNPKEGS